MDDLPKFIKYGDKETPMGEQSLEDWKKAMARHFPELAEPKVDKVVKGGKVLYVFSKQAKRLGQNALDKEIQVGEIVVVDASYVKSEVVDRRFRCLDGFGLHAFTSGGAIMGEWVADSTKDRIEGYMINQAETKALTKQ